jgi:hypothetical protein
VPSREGCHGLLLPHRGFAGLLIIAIAARSQPLGAAGCFACAPPPPWQHDVVGFTAAWVARLSPLLKTLTIICPPPVAAVAAVPVGAGGFGRLLRLQLRVVPSPPGQAEVGGRGVLARGGVLGVMLKWECGAC